MWRLYERNNSGRLKIRDFTVEPARKPHVGFYGGWLTGGDFFFSVLVSKRASSKKYMEIGTVIGVLFLVMIVYLALAHWRNWPSPLRWWRTSHLAWQARRRAARSKATEKHISQPQMAHVATGSSTTEGGKNVNPMLSKEQHRQQVAPTLTPRHLAMAAQYRYKPYSYEDLEKMETISEGEVEDNQ